jgi:transcriptional regulator with XRE-family HTH domain
MAERLGVSLASVQGAESGFRPVSRDLARRIQSVFGVFASSVTGFTREPVTLLGEKVTPESVERVINEEIQEITEKDLDQFTSPLRALVRAAAKAGHLRVFGAAYKDLLWEMKKGLDLDSALSAVLHDQAPAPAKTEITRKQLRESPDLAKALEMVGIVDDPSRPETEKIETTVRVKSQSAPWFLTSKWFPDWNEFVDEKGEVHWSDRGLENRR